MPIWILALWFAFPVTGVLSSLQPVPDPPECKTQPKPLGCWGFKNGTHLRLDPAVLMPTGRYARTSTPETGEINPFHGGIVNVDVQMAGLDLIWLTNRLGDFRLGLNGGFGITQYENKKVDFKGALMPSLIFFLRSGGRGISVRARRHEGKIRST